MNPTAPPTRWLRRALWTLVAAALLFALAAAVAGAGVLWRGWYDVAANRPHTAPVHALIEQALKSSVRRRARAIEEQPLPQPASARLQRGAQCYVRHCAACHGAPGEGPDLAALGAQPLPGPLVDATQAWRPRELVWIIRNGIRMSGMPAWSGRLADDDIWAVTAFLHRLPALSPADYEALEAQVGRSGSGACPTGPAAIEGEGSDEASVADVANAAGAPAAWPAPGRRRAVAGDAALREAGQRAVHRHGCIGCHQIPGVAGSKRWIGPPLAGFARRTTVAGVRPNTPDELVRWIRDPGRVKPGTAMPASGVGEDDARAIAAYLLTLR